MTTIDVDLKPCDLVRVQGLQARPEFNGSLGVLNRFLSDTGRWQVILARGASKNLKPENLTQEGLDLPGTAGFRRKKYQHCAVWPLGGGRSQRPVPVDEIQVSAFADWPVNYQEEIPYLKNTLGWKNPQILGGMTERGKPKPTFMMHCDVGDKKSSLNVVAQCIAAKLPSFELQKVQLPKDGMRGVVVLVYSPMTSHIHSSYAGDTVSQAGQPDTQFSLEQMREVAHFHTTDAAVEMYDAHDNPMHRVLGGT